MKSVISYIASIVLIGTLASCEKVINLDLPKGDPLPYIDAWISDQPGIQTVKFLKAVDYLTANEPEAISGADISITDLTTNTTYPFTYNNGAYNYDAGADAIGVVGHAYKLQIVYNGETFEATDTLKRVTAIDSLTYKFQEEDGEDKAGIYAKLYARDLPGAVDHYWIRTYRNGQLNYHVGEMLSVDGAFDNDGITDGYAFIPPFRDGITSGEKPYEKGETVTVLIRSLSWASYGFIAQALDQLENQGMFASVLQNVPANMKTTKAGSTSKIFGWFGMVAETQASKKIQ